MSQLGVLRVGNVEVLLDDQLVQQVFGHLAMDRHVVLAAREFRDGPAAGDDGECRHARDGKRLNVIAPEEHDRVRTRFVENLAQLLHRRGSLVELLRVLVGRSREQIRRVARTDCGNDLTHGDLPGLVAQVGYTDLPDRPDLRDLLLFLVYVLDPELCQLRAEPVKV